MKKILFKIMSEIMSFFTGAVGVSPSIYDLDRNIYHYLHLKQF